MRRTFDINVLKTVPLVTPSELKEALPMTEPANRTVVEGRDAIRDILQGTDSRLMAVVGPCSIHNEKAALEYAGRLAKLSRQVKDRLHVIMRVYFEKPRTTIGWKGLINDPRLDGSFDINDGLRKARELLVNINEMGLPAGTEMLDPITPQYIADLIAWGSIGARTTESQTHRQMASGLSMPIGYKNGTDGALDTALNAMKAARSPHSFLGIDVKGHTCIIQTKGNPLGHLILRGGSSGPNYYADQVERASEMLERAGLSPRLLVDCSHDNSGKDYRKQQRVWKDVLRQRGDGNTNIIGLMLESDLREGSQTLTGDPSQLEYGVSITDPCIGWEETEALLLYAFEALSAAEPQT